MTLAEAHTDKVRDAWTAYYLDTRTGDVEPYEEAVRLGAEHKTFSLSEALDLLAWAADQAYKDKIGGSHFSVTGSETWAAGCSGQGFSVRFTNENTASWREAILHAIDAIVEEHPEVLE